MIASTECIAQRCTPTTAPSQQPFMVGERPEKRDEALREVSGARCAARSSPDPGMYNRSTMHV